MIEKRIGVGTGDMAMTFFEIYPNMEIESQGKRARVMKLKDGISLPQNVTLGHFLDPIGGKHLIVPRLKTVYSGKAQLVTIEGALPQLTSKTLPYPLSYKRVDDEPIKYFKVTDRAGSYAIGEREDYLVAEIDHFEFLKLIRKFQDAVEPDKTAQQ